MTTLLLLPGDWSLRWAVLIAGAWAAFVIGPPSSVRARLWLLQLVLIGGLLLPLSPRWWSLAVPTPLVPAMRLPSREPVGIADIDVTPKATPTVVVSPVAQTIDGPTLLIGTWLFGVSVSLFRLLLGHWYLLRIRRAAASIGNDGHRELEAIRTELGVLRPVALLASSAVAGPALFGGWQPAVVVPTDWDVRTAGERRATLLHELSHVAHADDWATLFDEIVRAVFFFHPLVRWLLHRLACEREQRCDATAIQRGVSPRDLAQLLLVGARRLGLGRSLLAALPMVQRSSVGERIHQLLEADMDRWTNPLSIPYAVGTALITIGCCIGIGGLSGQTVDTTGEVADRLVNGIARDADGRPIAGATVLAIGDLGYGVRLTTTTDADGRFQFRGWPGSSDGRYETLVVAVKDGCAPVATYHRDSDKRPIALEFHVPGPYRGIVRDTTGRPVAGAEVQVGLGSGRVQLYWGCFPPMALRGTPAERHFFTTTDANGQFRFAALPDGGAINLRVTARGFAELDTSVGDTTILAHYAVIGAKPDEFVLQPEARLRGRIASQVAGVPANVAAVQLIGEGDLRGFQRVVWPDGAGRFDSAELPAGPLRVSLRLSDKTPATFVEQRVMATAGMTGDVALALITGVEVTGQVKQYGTGKPLTGARLSFHEYRRPRDYNSITPPTDADGRFTLRLPPGTVEVRLHELPESITNRTKGPWSSAGLVHRAVTIPAGMASYTIPEPFELRITPRSQP